MVVMTDGGGDGDDNSSDDDWWWCWGSVDTDGDDYNGGDVDAHIDITGRLEDGWRFPFNEAVVVKGRLGHRCDVVVPVSAELL